MIKHILILIWNKKKQNFLLFLEIFFAFLILFGVFTFVVENLRNYNTPLGFDTKNVWVAYMNIPEESDSAEIAQMKTLLRQEMIALPEIASISYSVDITPFSGSAWQTGNDKNGFDFNTRIIQNDQYYEKTGGLNIVEGRWFTEDDIRSKYRPVVISKQFRDKCWKGKPVIDSLFILETEGDFGDFVKIVGVVDHYKYMGEFTEEYDMTFVFELPTSKNLSSMHIRVHEGTKPDLEEKINKLIASITKRNDFTIQTLESRRLRDSRQTWTPIIILLGIGGFLIINVALGLFGVLWYNISKRRAEIGLRRTMGASKADISIQFIGEILMVTFISILIASFFTLQFPLMKLFDIANINYYYAMLISGVIILILVLICSFYPSRQAALINPAIVLHED
jgi:putative ABC transport system permease protein